MSKSPGLKPFNNFLHWCRKEPTVVREYKDALDEFVAPFLGKLRAQGAPAPLQALLEDWTYLERPLTSCKKTPLELYLRLVGPELAAADRKAFKGFLEGRIFGLFRIDAVEAGRGLTVSQLWTGRRLEVLDRTGSSQAVPGMVLLARLVPFKDHWIFPSFVTSLPAQAGEIEKSVTPEAAAAKTSWHRDALALLLGEGEAAVPLDAAQARARLASILERWGTSVSVSDIQKAVEEAHRVRGPMKPLTELLTRSAPTLKEANEALQALVSLWNALLPPNPSGAPGGPGPVERTIVRELFRETEAALRKADFEDPAAVERISREVHDRWLDTPQENHNGRTPRQVILEERAALGNPETRIRYSAKIEKQEAPLAEREAHASLKRADELLHDGDPARALPIYETAYSILKRETGVAYRLLGNMAGCHIQLGDREKAVELLRAALRVNPDYAIARNNLHLLESMTDAEYREKHRAGFFKKQRIVR